MLISKSEVCIMNVKSNCRDGHGKISIDEIWHLQQDHNWQSWLFILIIDGKSEVLFMANMKCKELGNENGSK
jgi:hypothetical protein